MAFKLRTSKRTEDIIAKLEASQNLPCYTLVKLAIALSIHKAQPLQAQDFETNTLGRELNRQTITGDADAVYKCIIELQEHRHLSDDEFFPKYIKAHIDRGMPLLELEERYSGDLLTHLSKLDSAL